MADKSGEAKQKDEGKPITEKDLEDISGGIAVPRDPITSIVTPAPTVGWADPPNIKGWQDPPETKN